MTKTHSIDKKAYEDYKELIKEKRVCKDLNKIAAKMKRSVSYLISIESYFSINY